MQESQPLRSLGGLRSSQGGRELMGGSLQLAPLGHPAEGEKQSSLKQAHNPGSDSSPWLSYMPSSTPVKSKTNCCHGAKGCEYAKASSPAPGGTLTSLPGCLSVCRSDGSALYSGLLAHSVPSALP